MRPALSWRERARSRLAAVMLGLAAALPAADARAMTVVREGATLFATGLVADDDFVRFKTAFAEGGLQRVVFVNSPGGDLWTGLQVGRLIRDAGLETRVSGYCHSACSIMFLGGRDRRFATGFPPRATMIGLHGPHNRITRSVSTEAAPQIYAFYRMQMGERFHSGIINQALYDLKDAAGMLRVRDTGRNPVEDQVPWFCPAGTTPLAQCERHVGHDAYTLGLVTERETQALELPPAMRANFSFYGVRPNQAITSLQDSAPSSLAGYGCEGASLCAVMALPEWRQWRELEPHRAFAIGVGRRGYGGVHRADDPWSAAARALYLCNHARNNPKLCRLVAVDDHLVPDLQAQAQQRTRAVLQALPAPDAQALQEERDESGGAPVSTLRTGDAGGLTPRALEGVTRWDTATLAQALAGPQPPLLVDVGGIVDAMLPGAVHFLRGGLALADAAADKAFDERFRRMLEAAGAVPERPLVFYGDHSWNWWAVNAALRARAAGHAQVGWYRGGLAAWVKAGLPVVPKSPSAVLHVGPVVDR
jgi:rhodanese-related sulfurtransferase